LLWRGPSFAMDAEGQRGEVLDAGDTHVAAGSGLASPWSQ
jgi:hypothetical protein